MYFASGSCTMVLPPSKRQKAPKTAWTRCPSRFFTIPPSATSCTHLSLQGEAKRLIYFYSARFSHFIDSLRKASEDAFPCLIMCCCKYPDYPQTSSAISLTSLSFAHCSSSVSLLPISQEAKPHCGLRQSLSSETYFAAS